MSLNAITVRRYARLLVGPTTRVTALPDSLIASFNLNLQQQGYTLAPKTINHLRQMSREAFVEIAAETLAVCKELRGSNVKYVPMYPNFPEQVAEASDAELYINAILHYWSFYLADAMEDASFVWLPKYRKNAREPLDEKIQLTVLRHMRPKELEDKAHAIVMSNTSISEIDKADLKLLMAAGYGLPVSKDIPNKENQAIAAATAWIVRKDIGAAFLCKTATDVLRFAAALSGGDVSLAEPTKFRSFSRPERRLILEVLSSLPVISMEEDMLRWKSRWLRLGERLHPREFKSTVYHRARNAFKKLRNDLHIETFASVTEALVRERSYDKLSAHLMKRPGDFARRMDQILRMVSSRAGETMVTGRFDKVAENVSTPVLLQMLAHFKGRNFQSMRVVFPKGNMAKVRAIEGVLFPISNTVCQSVISIVEQVLDDRFSELPPLGKVWVDPALSTYLVPFSQRSASKSLRTLVRGSRIPFSGGDKDTLRFFIHWKNCAPGESKGEDVWAAADGRVDLDISALMYDDQWRPGGQIWYGNLRTSEYRAYHSGDITNAPKGACEFIDLDIPSMLAYGQRYVIMNVRSFTGQTFDCIPECYAGWMLREEPKSGEVFDPRTVQDKIDLAAAGTIGMPLIIDLEKREIIWCDAILRQSGYINNANKAGDAISLIGRAFTKIQKPDLYTLFQLHGRARGRLVKEEGKADIKFTVENAFELERIASEFMQNAIKKEVRRGRRVSV